MRRVWKPDRRERGLVPSVTLRFARRISLGGRGVDRSERSTSRDRARDREVRRAEREEGRAMTSSKSFGHRAAYREAKDDVRVDPTHRDADAQGEAPQSREDALGRVFEDGTTSGPRTTRVASTRHLARRIPAGARTLTVGYVDPRGDTPGLVVLGVEPVAGSRSLTFLGRGPCAILIDALIAEFELAFGPYVAEVRAEGAEADGEHLGAAPERAAVVRPRISRHRSDAPRRAGDPPASWIAATKIAATKRSR
jgi:hypothetical protein